MEEIVINVGEVRGSNVELRATRIVNNEHLMVDKYMINIYLGGHLFYCIDPNDFGGSDERCVHICLGAYVQGIPLNDRVLRDGISSLIDKASITRVKRAM